MDVTMLANQLVEAVAPFLPFLTTLGKETAEEAGRQLGAEAWEHAKALWGRLGGRIEERPAALEAVQEVVKAPEDGDAIGALRVQVRKLLTDDEALANELLGLLNQRRSGVESSVIVKAGGERSIAVGGDVTGSRLETGDRMPDSD